MRTKDGRRHSGTAVRRGQDVPHGAGRGILAFIAAAAGTLALLLAGLAPPAHAQGATDPALDKEICLGCHGQKGYSAKGPDGKPQSLHVTPERFGGSVHGKRQCVECHRNIDEIPHKPGTEVRVSCVQCHEDLWEQARRE
ncbi:MAG: hypothetical protein IT514_07035, partial [Burkholderiales bacterium]|nr:hypothetical protein [Burkholderiales bacterium]